LEVAHYGTVGAASFAGIANGELAIVAVHDFDFDYGRSIIDIGEKRIAILS